MKKFVNLNHSDGVFIMLINVKMPTIVGILIFMRMKNFMLSCVEHENDFITSGPVILDKLKKIMVTSLRMKQRAAFSPELRFCF